MTLTPQPPPLARARKRVTGLLAVPAGAIVLGACLASCGNPHAQAAGGAAHHPQMRHQGHASMTGGAGARPQPSPTTAKLPRVSMEKLKAAAGCPEARLQVDADELKQAACRTERGWYTIVTFTEDEGKRAWLDHAQPYGGTYLVGDRWTVVSTPELLDGLRRQVGGQIETGARHH
ncbi:hypothetical protein [Nonomuraea sp. NPDC049309]|uniref:hypothetical protein n=1 Tax=Nonomuraea sp. NPDC049309 TaxID=3364350 RepID=UPI00371541D7